MLYVQMLLSTLVGLYMSRAVLNELGVEDYGVYNAVAGVVSMFGLLNISMSGTTARFITFELGSGNPMGLKKLFSLSLTIHLLLGVLVVLIAESVGVWFVRHHMQIPVGRMEAAEWVLHGAVLTSFFSILNVPYNAMIVAHERMNVFAYFSLIDVFIKLGLVLGMGLVEGDKLIYYAVALLVVHLVMQLLYGVYCFRCFEASQTGPGWEKKKFNEMAAFAGWSLFGDSAALLFTQGLNILLNVFFGPVVNAARGIAVQVQGVLMRFIGSFQMALNPQLTKSFASGEQAYMHKLIYASSKFSFLLFLGLSLPMWLEAKQVLYWWLNVVPAHTVSFLRIMLLVSLVDCLANPLVIAAKASGNIRHYQAVLGSLLLIIVPISYLLLKMGFRPESVFWVHLTVVCVGHYVRVRLVRPLVGLDVGEYLQQVIVKVVGVGLLAPIVPAIFHATMHEGIARFLAVGVLSVVSIGLVSWGVALDDGEKHLIRKQIRVFSKRSYEA